MMKKDEQGISLIMLVISIVVMLLLTAIVLNSSLNSIEEVQEVKLEDEIRNLREAANDRLINYERNEFIYPLVGLKIEGDIYAYIRSISTLSSSEMTKAINSVSETYSSATSDYFRIVTSEDAIRLGVSNIESGERFIVDYYNVEVYGPVTAPIIELGETP